MRKWSVPRPAPIPGPPPPLGGRGLLAVQSPQGRSANSVKPESSGQSIFNFRLVQAVTKSNEGSNPHSCREHLSSGMVIKLLTLNLNALDSSERHDRD